MSTKVFRQKQIVCVETFSFRFWWVDTNHPMQTTPGSPTAQPSSRADMHTHRHSDMLTGRHDTQTHSQADRRSHAKMQTCLKYMSHQQCRYPQSVCHLQIIIIDLHWWCSLLLASRNNAFKCINFIIQQQGNSLNLSHLMCRSNIKLLVLQPRACDERSSLPWTALNCTDKWNSVTFDFL